MIMVMMVMMVTVVGDVLWRGMACMMTVSHDMVTARHDMICIVLLLCVLCVVCNVAGHGVGTMSIC